MIIYPCTYINMSKRVHKTMRDCKWFIIIITIITIDILSFFFSDLVCNIKEKYVKTCDLNKTSMKQ